MAALTELRVVLLLPVSYLHGIRETTAPLHHALSYVFADCMHANARTQQVLVAQAVMG
jgi:hypothetical protein